jgi:hypothetical protein
MTICVEKMHHQTEREAYDHLAWARKTARKQIGGGKELRHLGIYRCSCGAGWCVGRSWKTRRAMEAAQPKPDKTTNRLSSGQQRRMEKHAAEKAARQAMYADYHQTLQFCKMLVDRELARYEALGIKPRAQGEKQ